MRARTHTHTRTHDRHSLTMMHADPLPFLTRASQHIIKDLCAKLDCEVRMRVMVGVRMRVMVGVRARVMVGVRARVRRGSEGKGEGESKGEPAHH